MRISRKWLSVMTAAALLTAALPLTVSAASNDNKVRLVIENSVFREEDGADWSGTLIDEWLPIDETTTALSLFTAALDKHGYTQSGAEYEYVTEINGLSGEDGGAMGCWMVTIDDWFTDEGIGAYTVSSGKLESGDEICFRYSLSWGADLGYDWSGSDTSLKSISVEGGSLTKEFSAGTYDYVLQLEDGADTVTIHPYAANPYYRVKVYHNTYTPAEAGTDYKFSQAIPVEDGDVLIIGVGSEAWMQNNYNQAAESVYRLSVNKPVQMDVMVQEAESYINAIGTVTADSGEAIRLARSFYDSLTEEQKAQVSNYDVLLAAEEAYAALSQEKTAVTPEELRENIALLMPAEPAFGNEWEVINYARCGWTDEKKKASYVNSVLQAIQDSESAKLSATRSTVNAGVVTALTALGVDASDFYGYDLLEPLSDLEYVTQQGVNGAVYALIAFDSHSYDIPEAKDTAVPTTREALVQAILSAQESDGGWTIDTWSGADDGSDADMTAMALQALAPYTEDAAVKEAVERALTFLSDNQNDKGQFRSYGSVDCESSAQVITALCSLGIDPQQDTRFVKEQGDAYDGLLTFYAAEQKGFSHFESGESNTISTRQAYSAAAALYRFRQNMTTLYDMNDTVIEVLSEEVSQVSEESSAVSEQPAPVTPATPVKTGSEMPLTLMILAGLSAAVTVLTLTRKQSQSSTK